MCSVGIVPPFVRVDDRKGKVLNLRFPVCVEKGKHVQGLLLKKTGSQESQTDTLIVWVGGGEESPLNWGLCGCEVFWPDP